MLSRRFGTDDFVARYEPATLAMHGKTELLRLRVSGLRAPPRRIENRSGSFGTHKRVDNIGTLCRD